MLPVPIDTQLLLTSIGHVDNKGLVSADILVWLNVLADYCQLDALLYMYMCNHAVHGAWASGHKNKRRRSTMQVCFSCGNIWSSQEFAQGQVFLWNVTVCVWPNSCFINRWIHIRRNLLMWLVKPKLHAGCLAFTDLNLWGRAFYMLSWSVLMSHDPLRLCITFCDRPVSSATCHAPASCVSCWTWKDLPWQLTTLKTHFHF